LQIHDFDRPQYEVLLPGSKTMFPRAKRVPEAKEPTKWEKFSKDKGIVKRKRSRMVLDEVSG
jgi:regulator of ribosome biosynthesis